MNPELLAEVGDALYGPRWQADLCRVLEVKDRTMRRWLTGEVEIPFGIAKDLAKVVKDRVHRLTAMAEVLDDQPVSPLSD